MEIVRWIIRGILSLVYKVKVEGIENVKGLEKGLICVNHTSWLDGVLVYAYFPKKVYIMGKESIFKFKPLGYILKKLGGIPVARNNRDVKATMHVVNLINSNKFTVIFPEGTRNGIEKGEPIKKGAIYIAVKSECKIIPMYIPKDQRLFRSIKLVIGKPIEYEDKPRDREYLQDSANKLMEYIMTLKG